jgi:predicted membrane protein
MTEWDKDPGLEARIKGGIEARARAGANCHPVQHGIIWGAVICLIGIVLLLDHLGLVSVDHLWRFWPLLIVIAGVVNVTQGGKRVWGALLLVVGLLFQLDSLGVIRFHWADLWPLAIIAAGLIMIWGSIESRRAGAGSSASGQAGMNATAIFGGVERRITARDFRSGRVTSVFGGTELDFHDADIEGDEAVLEVNAIFGGAEIRVPETWRVEARSQTLFGGYSDTTRVSPTLDANPPKRKTLIITGTILFGGVEVKN